MPETGMLQLMKWLTVNGTAKLITEQTDLSRGCEQQPKENNMWPYTEEEVKWLSGKQVTGADNRGVCPSVIDILKFYELIYTKNKYNQAQFQF